MCRSDCAPFAVCFDIVLYCTECVCVFSFNGRRNEHLNLNVVFILKTQHFPMKVFTEEIIKNLAMREQTYEVFLCSRRRRMRRIV